MRTLSLMPLLVLTAACVQESQELPRVQVKVTQAEWVRGEAEDILLVFQNTALRPFTYTSSSCTEPVAWVEAPGAPEKIWLRPRAEPDGCAHVSLPVTVEPGQRLDAVYVWNGSANPGRDDAALFPSGIYVLRGGFFGDTSWDATGSATIRLR